MKKITVLFSVIFLLLPCGCSVAESSSMIGQIRDSDLDSITELKLGMDTFDYILFTDDIKIHEEDSTLAAIIYVTAYEGKDKYEGRSQAPELIRWVSSNEDVVTVNPNVVIETMNSPHVSLKYEIKGEGETEIHAETIDGRVKSESFKVSVGNRYIKEKAVIRYTGEEIISRLKYPTKTTTVLDSSREPFFFMYKNRRIYTYNKNKQNSYVDVESVEMNGVNAKTKGTIHTFSSGGMDAVGSFIMELKFSEDFNTYTIISEKYDIPELIRMPLE